MRNKILLTSIIFIGKINIITAQVGINNADPKATLDVTAKSTDGSKPEGLIAPRLTGDQIKAADAQYGSAQTGTIIYATAAVGTASTKTANITAAGYYYFDGTLWQRVGAGSSTNIYNADGTLTSDRTMTMGGYNLVMNGGSVAIGTATPNAAAVLDVSSSNKGLLLPRVASTAAVTSPANGLLVYDISSTCIKTYENSAWSDCLSGSKQTVTAKATTGTNGFNGTYIPGSAANAAGTTTFVVTLENNSFSLAQFTPSVSDITLSGAGGLSVSSVSPNTAQNISGGSSLTITYTLSGTVPASGIVTGTFSRLGLTDSNILDLDKAPTWDKVLYNGCNVQLNSTGTLSGWSSSNSNITVNGSGLSTGASDGGVSIVSAALSGYAYRLGRSMTSGQRLFAYNGPYSTPFTIPSTFIPSFQVEIYGAGGSGGAAWSDGGSFRRVGGGGGGGAYSNKLFTTVAGQTSLTLSIPAGAAQTGGNGVDGFAGAAATATYNGNTITANGGSAGKGAVGGSTNVSGGIATGGDINISGGSGFGNGTTYGNTATVAGGNGGNAGNQTAFAVGNHLTGVNGPSPGGGGAGGGLAFGTPSWGGFGGSGLVVITYTCP